MEVLQSLVPMTIGFNNKPILFPLFSFIFIIFITWGILAKLWHFGVGADSLEVLQSEPVNYSGFQPSAVMPSLKPAPQEQLRAGKTSETAENILGTYTNYGK